jgi:hypothetical protein
LEPWDAVVPWRKLAEERMRIFGVGLGTIIVVLILLWLIF